ncbi:OmpW family protein [Marinicella sp. W31]|uniref:OmpW/AlkL family protein n=1 Tax=Marinicella sp. W31 TaxID=3023713 RepID=UPI003756DD68
MQKKILLLALLPCCGAAWADTEKGWFIKPVAGISQMSSTEGNSVGVGAQNGLFDVDLSSGFFAGLGVGYRYNANISAEFSWEYRSNDSETTLADGTLFSDGNYASSIFYMNGYYHFENDNRWTPYLGLGLGWIQEIDIDLEGMGPEQSYSGDGEIGFQAMFGLQYDLSENWTFNTELRYARFSSIDLEGEEAASGRINDLDYDPVTLGIGLSYYF